MDLKVTIISLILSLFLCNCSTNSSKSPENIATTIEIQEIQNLDSLNQQIDESTIDIEQSILSVEAALSELDDF